MGAEDSQKKSFFSTKVTFKNRSTIFTLGNRDTVLTTELEDPIIIIPHAQKVERRVSGTPAPLLGCLLCEYAMPLPLSPLPLPPLPCSTRTRHCSAVSTLPSWTTRAGSTYLSWISSTSIHPPLRTSSTPFWGRPWPICWSVQWVWLNRHLTQCHPHNLQ